MKIISSVVSAVTFRSILTLLVSSYVVFACSEPSSEGDIRGAGGNVEFVVWWTVGHPGAGPYQQVLADLDLDSLAEMRLP